MKLNADFLAGWRGWWAKIVMLILIGALVLTAGCSGGGAAPTQATPTPTPTPSKAKATPTPTKITQTLAPANSATIVDFTKAVLALRAEREGMIQDWNTWLGSTAKAQASQAERLARYEAFWAKASDLADRAYRLYRPPAAREVHDKLNMAYGQQCRAMEMLISYEKTGDETLRVEGNDSFYQAAILFRQAEEALFDLLAQNQISPNEVGL